METGKLRRISIVEPYEYENLVKQAQLIDAEKESVEASESTAFSTKILAFVTAVLAGLTFIHIRESRRARASEIHTGELKEVIKFWKEGLLDAPNQNIPVEKSLKPEEYQFEKNRLFPDIKNHASSEWNILRAWTQFKKGLKEYEEKRRELFDVIRHSVLKKTELEYNPELAEDKEGISRHFIRHIYQQLWAEGKEKSYNNTQPHPTDEGNYVHVYGPKKRGEALFKVLKVSGEDLIDKTFEVYKDMMDNPDKLLEQFRVKIDDINKCKKSLDDMHGRLRQMLDDLSSIPIYLSFRV